MLFRLLNRYTNLLTLVAFSKRTHLYTIISLTLLLQGVSTIALAEWTNLWPFYVSENSNPNCGIFLYKENCLGPLIEQKYTEEQHIAAIRPIGLHIDNYKCQQEFDYFLYPLFSQTKTIYGITWNMLGLISGSKSNQGTKMMIFPFYFANHTCDPCTSYSGFFPIGGFLRNHFGFDSIQWLAWPLYLALERNCTTRHALPWPFIRWQTGPNSGGGALWPLLGSYWKAGEYQHNYFLWPLIYRFCDQLHCPTPSYRIGFLPFFAYENSAKRKMTTIIWPFFSHVEMHDRNYIEDQFIWPFFVQGRGDNEYVNRWAPFYTYSIRRGHHKKWCLWPMLKIQNWQECGVHISQEQLFYFLFWKQRQTCLTNPHAPEALKIHLWPLFSYWNNGAGQKQFQFLSPLEVLFPTNQAVRNLYSPLFAIFRHEQRAPGHSRQSILFDLIATEKTPCSQHLSLGPVLDLERTPCLIKFEILKGLLGYKKENGKKSLKILWIKLM
ncbi:hypothetical protein AYO37_01275 [Opitutia bacterium SCGC AG-212-L18]|nr:hypothetical protein AYO37_01275 [Opitutae bacterium SCGC AG-212-L18]